MTAEPIPAEDSQPAENHPAYLSDSDIALITEHCPQLMESITAVEQAAERMTDNAAIDAHAALAIGKGLELLRRKVESATARNTRLMAEQVEPSAFGVRKLPALLAQKMRITPREASRRLALSRCLTESRTASGQAVPAPMPRVSECLSAGTISIDQTQAIIREIDAVPPRIRAEHASAIEEVLVENAPDLRVTDFRILGKRILGHLDPDGRAETEPAHPDDYFVTVNQKRNGDWTLHGLLDSITGLTLNALLTNRQHSPADIAAAAHATAGAAEANPAGTAADSPGTRGSPGTSGTSGTPSSLGSLAGPETPDTSGSLGSPDATVPADTAGLGHLDAAGASHGPPAHDSFASTWDVPSDTIFQNSAGEAERCWSNAVTADGTPAVAPVFSDSRPDGARRHDRFSILINRGAVEPTGAGSYALVVTATADQLARGHGEVEAAGGHTQLENILDLSPAGRFYFAAHRPGTRDVRIRTEARFATPTQMTLLKARDRGCTFPDCDIPAGWCEAHHMHAHRYGGPTDLNNLTLLCRFHHGWHERHGWRSELLNGLPAWIPPQTLDRQQKPLYHSRFAAELTDAETLFPDHRGLSPP